MTKLFDMRITAGNIITIITMAIGGLWVIAELKAADGVTNTRLATLEDRARRTEADRDVLMEIRGDMKAMRVELNRILKFK